MDRLQGLALFVRIVDRGSFTAAASDLGISRPAATEAINRLERRLGTRLLQRSTRQLRPTGEGQEYYRRCVTLLADLEDADQAASGALVGTVRADVPGTIARTLLLPALPDFLERHPGLAVHLGEGERLVDLIREGFDCVVRAGHLDDSDMTARRLGVLEEVTVASPSYLERHGMPTAPDALGGHVAVGFVSSRTRAVMPLEFTVDGRSVEVGLPARVLVHGADMSAAAALRGLGLVQAPRYRFEREFASGALVEVLAGFRPPPTLLSILTPSHRQTAPRVRVFVDWLARTIAPLLTRA